MSEFLHMGGYAAYVWPSYGLALVILVYNLIGPLAQHRRLRAAILRKARRAGRHAR